jgi:HTH-type transcriptional regulator/antitoxin HipB
MFVKNPRDLGLLIRDRRRALRLDQGSLAARVGVSRQWLVQVEKGKARAEVGLVLRTLNALGMSLDVVVAPPPGESDIDRIVARARGREP